MREGSGGQGVATPLNTGAHPWSHTGPLLLSCQLPVASALSSPVVTLKLEADRTGALMAASFEG